MTTQRQIEDNDFPASGTGKSSKPTTVLVHGALEDASIWNAVIPRLQLDGYPVIGFANLLLGVAVDAAYLRTFWTGSRGSRSSFPTPTAGPSSPRPGTTPRSRALSTRPLLCPQ
jgi:pimeloyl-ACP methyl ester carboxylesterase